MKRRIIPVEAPHRNGFTIPIEELELESHLDLENPYSFNLHHMQWPKRTYEATALYGLLRHLQGHQERTPKDAHAQYHMLYTPPQLPPPHAVMSRIADAYDAGEQLQIRNPNIGYSLHPITSELFRAAVRDYEEMR